MFTSEAELQWYLKVGREALEMIMCFFFSSSSIIPHGEANDLGWGSRVDICSCWKI